MENKSSELEPIVEWVGGNVAVAQHEIGIWVWYPSLSLSIHRRLLRSFL
jgi:hypothetical protein